MTTYRSKAKDSFDSRMRFFKFQVIVNNTEFTKEEFLKFNLDKNQNIVKIYTSQYFQLEKDTILENTNTRMKIEEVYEAIKNIELSKEDTSEWFEAYLLQFKDQYSPEQFIKHINAKECYYCHITLDDIDALATNHMLFKKNERGYVMEIDRKEPNKEYSDENCVPACYWCNNAKTDEFNEQEFKPIAEQIKKVFDKRLGK